jgi:hypothetical protein
MIMRAPCKLKVPVFQGKEFQGKVIYFADPLLTLSYATLEEEFIKVVYEPCEVSGIRFTNYECTDENPLYPEHRYYEILFFDYGGISLGNSMLETLSKFILKVADEHLSRLYCMVSTMTQSAVKDAMQELGKFPENVFLDIEDLCKIL